MGIFKAICRTTSLPIAVGIDLLEETLIDPGNHRRRSVTGETLEKIKDDITDDDIF